MGSMWHHLCMHTVSNKETCGIISFPGLPLFASRMVPPGNRLIWYYLSSLHGSQDDLYAQYMHLLLEQRHFTSPLCAQSVELPPVL